MKSMFRYALVAVVAITLITSCKSKSPKQASLIPKDATAIFVIDQEAIAEKLKKGNIQIDASIEKMFTMIDSVKGKKIFAEAKNAGVDYKEKMFAFITQKGNPMVSQTTSLNLIAVLSDATKFEAFLKAQEELKGMDVKKGKNYSYIQMGNDGMISWTSELAMVTGFNVAQSGNFDKVTGEYKAPTPINKDAEIKKLVESFYSLKDADKVGSVKYFNEMLNEKADAYMFASSTSTINALSMMPFQLPKLEELMKDNYATTTINFEDGKVVANGIYHFNDRVNALMKQYGSSSVKASMIENFPSQNINAAMLMSFKPEMVGGLVKELDLETLANVGLSQMGITMQDIYKSLKGDMAFALGDFSMNVDTSKGFAMPTPTLKYIFNAEVGDKTSLDKVLSKAVEMQLVQKNGGVYTANPAMKTPFVYVRIDDKNIIVASDSITYTQYAAKASKANINKDFAGNLSGKSMAMYANITSFISAFASTAGNDAHANAIINKAIATFNDATMTADNIADGKLKSKGEFTFKNDKQNSLISIAEFVKTAVDEMKKVETERNARRQMIEDSPNPETMIPAN